MEADTAFAATHIMHDHMDPTQLASQLYQEESSCASIFYIFQHLFSAMMPVSLWHHYLHSYSPKGPIDSMVAMAYPSGQYNALTNPPTAMESTNPTNYGLVYLGEHAFLSPDPVSAACCTILTLCMTNYYSH